MKKLIFIVIIVLMVGSIYVVGSIYGKDSEDPIEMSLNYLEEKYGESFTYSRHVISTGGTFDSSYIRRIYYTCDSFPGKEILVKDDNGEIRDNYLFLKYNEDIKKIFEESSLKYFNDVLVLYDWDSGTTARELSAQASLEEVFADHGFKLSARIILKKSEVTSKDAIDNMLYKMFKEPWVEMLNRAAVTVEVVPEDVYDELGLGKEVNLNEVVLSYKATVHKEQDGDSYIDWHIINGKNLEFKSQIQNIGENVANDCNGNNIISDKWEDGEFLYDNKKIKLMCNCISDLGKMRINEETINMMVISKTQLSEWYVINNSNEIKSFLECQIYGINAEIYVEDYEKNPSEYSKIQLSKGITWKSTVEDIINAYGPPQKEEKKLMGATYRILSYEAENGTSLKLTVHEDLGVTGILLKSKI